MNQDESDSGARKPSYAITVAPRLYTVPLGAVLLGAMIGVNRGARLASLRFLAENAHRTPTTQKGWYYYHKTKNYRVILGRAAGGCARRGVSGDCDGRMGGARGGTACGGMGTYCDERGRGGYCWAFLRAL
ncbi:hypothetical protein DFH09DRAFT_902159 [Mycena vulgaris]|nr:hypothetical protein DFH09DRAFT_902159 [Mycena vulgaris]